ncbi:MAG TPA: S8 family peptidase [Gaiellaceae bacterium]|nr:S8 family peptidase [Gaiellaceae bacterium]
MISRGRTAPPHGRAWGLLTVAALFALVLVASAASASRHPKSVAPHRNDRVLVGYKRGLTVSARTALKRRVGAWTIRTYINGSELLRVRPGRVEAVIKALRASGKVRYAEPDYIEHVSAVTVPNDPSFTQQWAFRNTGQSVGGSTGTPGADESATAAWSVTTGSRSIVVAEVDTGVDYNHPDLAANIWTNPGGINGCAAGTHGYSVLTGACDPMDDDTVYGGHGTHVAGIIGAVGSNGVGVTGVNWQTTILPVKWVNASGSGSTSNLLAALDWVLKAQAAGVNIRVVNDSQTWVGTSISQALSDEIDLLGQHNILMVTAAGNTGQNNDDPAVRRYPCGYDRPTEICVTASDQNDALPSWANYGATTVDLAAPGNHIYSTLRNGGYGFIDGGSMAAPQVSGAAALILSTGSYTAAQLKAQILNNVDPLPSLTGKVRTGGRLDICKAIPGCSTAVAAPVNTAVPVISGTAQSGQTLASSTGTWQNSPTGYAYQWARCNTSCTTIGGATSASYQATDSDVGAKLQVTVTASNSGGSTPATSAQTATVQSAATGGGTFGTTSVGPSTDQLTANAKRANRYQLPVAATVSKLSAYLQPTGTSGSQLLEGIVYADTRGAPGARLGVSQPITFKSTQQAGWYDLVFQTPIKLAAGNYWIGMIAGTTSKIAAFRYTSVTGSRAYNNDNYANGANNPFGSATVDSEQMSVYATYGTSAPPPPPPAPVNAGLPVISGTAQSGQMLSASTGTWQNSPTGYGYQWSRCTSICATVSGATGSTYSVSGADVGAKLQVTVTASNAGGSTVATSSQTAAVQPAPSGSGTFGTTSIGPSSDQILAARKRVNRYQLPVAGAVSKLTVYLQPTGTSGSQTFKGVIYADNNGAPGALLGTTTEISFQSAQQAGWYDLVFQTPVNLVAGSYWIGLFSGATSYVAAFRYQTQSNSRVYNADSYGDGPANPFGTPNFDSELMSVYATYSSP